MVSLHCSNFRKALSVSSSLPHFQEVPSSLGRCYLYHHHRVVDMTSRPNTKPRPPLYDISFIPCPLVPHLCLWTPPPPACVGGCLMSKIFSFHAKRSSVPHSSKPRLKILPTCTNCLVRAYGGFRSDPFFLQSVLGLAHFGLIRQWGEGAPFTLLCVL